LVTASILSIWISHFAAGSGSSGSPSVFSGVFVAENFDGTGDKGSGDTKATDVQTFLEAIFKMSLRSACLIDAAVSVVKSKTSNLGLWSSSASLSDVGLKEFCCNLRHTYYYSVYFPKQQSSKYIRHFFFKVFFGSGIWVVALKNIQYQHFETEFLERDVLRTDDSIYSFWFYMYEVCMISTAHLVLSG